MDEMMKRPMFYRGKRRMRSRVGIVLAIAAALGIVLAGLVTAAAMASPGYGPVPLPSLSRPTASVTRSPVRTISPAPTAISAPPSEHGAATPGTCGR